LACMYAYRAAASAPISNAIACTCVSRFGC
jgi:hypothetical protein